MIAARSDTVSPAKRNTGQASNAMKRGETDRGDRPMRDDESCEHPYRKPARNPIGAFAFLGVS
ncbi:hypothetical protein AA0488_1165 [Kozakia baliensis NRIC 0488]|uniref:Uncharacterized protein n=1 Tax=Kozakia baliensis TaxID=153496 RepID=A0A1D8UQK3_9PROT|nr:hypothetical protein [Kozakia baliensis]AOX15920.1 hypothetical protein A0U89_00875 [Kozakia baliensis]GBR27529.1 hypothetical protein AA0488_1165 [Kozakia baliensis NRIC 0488]GEL64193.1 hypothetical protein KBA01_14790 [Kozakia baliensis]